MEVNKKHRAVLRGAFTKRAGTLEGLCAAPKETRDQQQIKVEWELLQVKFEELSVVENKIYEEMLEQATEEELSLEMDGFDKYRRKQTELRMKIEEADAKEETASSHSEGPLYGENGYQGRRKFKLPIVELRKFNGDLKEWLPFWSQFKKVHEDPDIDLADKIGYLTQAMVPGSTARQLVESFPAVSENYSKIMDSLHNRFGREDLQVEVYVRELLKLVLNRFGDCQLGVSVLYDKIESQLRSLETLGITSDKYAAILYPLIESCLPEEMIRLWHRSTGFMKPLSTERLDEVSQELSLENRLEGLMRFLQAEVEHEQKICLAAEGFGLKPTNKAVKGEFNVQKPDRSFRGAPAGDQQIATAAGLINGEVAKCLFCSGQHENKDCYKARKFPMDQKRELLFKGGACYRCLKQGHPAKRCHSHPSCIICGKGHVALMCPEASGNKKTIVNTTVKESGHVDHTLSNITSTHVFLQTLRVHIEGPRGVRLVRALMDTGSQRSYILRSTARRMGLTCKRREKIVHALFGGKNTSEQTHECYDVKLIDCSFYHTFEALDQPVICNDILPIFQGPWIEELDDLDISLSDRGEADPIELLLGADVIGFLYTGRKHLLQCGITALETTLGWTLMGKMSEPPTLPSTTMVVFSLLVNDSAITNLWELDAIGITDPTEKATRTELAEQAKVFFNETVRLNKDGRYEVRLPWLSGHPPLADNYSLAKKRVNAVIQKLKRMELFEAYESILLEWLQEGVIERVAQDQAAKAMHYLPHRPVFKDSSETTKIRPVFDASSHEKGKPSLNQCLEVGPNMIEIIADVLLHFRQNRIGVVSDIRKAFLQISVHPADRGFLQFLWIDKEGNEVIFRHRRVVFGVSSSPFLLGATIEHHLLKMLEKCEKNGDYSKDTIDKLLKGFCVDNCVTSVVDEIARKKFMAEASTLMLAAKMELRGWEFSGTNRAAVPVLGLWWNTESDSLSINTGSLGTSLHLEYKDITKRMMLSLAQRIFDPIGFTCPVSLYPKLLLQKLWERRQGWDVPVEEEVAKDFQRWAVELLSIAEISVPRWIQMGSEGRKGRSLHIFADASKKAYAAAVFLRVERETEVRVYLLAAKSRVAPLKEISIPRLELLAATIAARLFHSVKKQFSQDIQSFFWSDSTTVISWIRRQELWSTFVFNRVSEIRRLTDIGQWNHVPGLHNPADLPSRGCFGKRLLESRWWEGPQWLYTMERWPQKDICYDEDEIGREKRKTIITTLLNVDPDEWHFDYFSQYSKLLRMVAWIQRFCNNARKLSQRRQGELTAEEVDRAEIFVLRVVQQESFDPACQRIASMRSFVDDTGLIRVKTRVAERPDTMNFCVPVVLPGDHTVVRRLIMDLHRRSCHMGIQGLLSLLREKYWILGGRRVVRTVLKQCGICKRHNSKPFTVETPPLPLNRVRDAKVFEVTGIDLAGPLYLRDGEKAWTCIFTCAVYRAVHFELVTSLSTDAFIQAFRRFVSRRGRPSMVYSDNGTNFVGFDNQLQQIDWTYVTQYSATERIRWYFNPPTAAWWGGFWERLIRILKGLLKKVLGRARLNYENLLTILCECENIINSRPITYLSEDPSEFAALTPNMFLRDQPAAGMPDCDLIETTSLCRKARHRQQLREHLQVRFRSEYLAQLRFGNNPDKQTEITVGDVVLIGHDNLKRLDWPLGKVIEVIPGKDRLVRLVRLQTSQGQLLRPLQRLYLLEASTGAIHPRKEGEESTSGDSAGVSKSRVTSSENVELPQPESSTLIRKATRSGRLIKLPPRYQ